MATVSARRGLGEHSEGDAPAAKGAAGLASAVGRSPGHVRTLLMVVILLGVLLLAGFGTVVIRIIYLAGQPSRPGVAAVAAPRGITLALPSGAQVRHTSISGDRLALTYDSPQHSGIVVMDIGTGQVLSRIQFVEEVPGR